MELRTYSPIVSVIVPAYGRAELIQQALASCTATGEVTPLEVIVVDDGSPVSLDEVVAPYGVVFHRLAQNAGSSVARNVGLELARGRYVKFLDSDDVLFAGALVHEVRLADETNADIVVSGWRNLTLEDDGSSRIDSVSSAPVFDVIPDDLLAGRAVPTSAALYRRHTVKCVKWDPALSKLNDWDYFVQAALVSSKIATSNAVAYDWRAHAGERITSSSSFLKNANEFYVILQKLIDELYKNGHMTEPRKYRAAQYLYKELRGLYRFDVSRGRAVLAQIKSLDARFEPLDEERSRLFRLLGKSGLLSPTLEAYGFLRRIIDASTRSTP